MDKTQYSQLELFSESGIEAVEKRSLQASLLHFIKTYEKVIFVLIGLLVTAITAFSLGVEKGKRLLPVPEPQATQPVAKRIPLPVQPAAAPLNKKINPLPPLENAQLENSLIAPQGFTIQIASYQTKSYALKEAQALRKNGFLPSVLTKGKFAVLCVGNFSNKKSAEMMLAKFKKQYQGCFIRRL